MKKTLLAVALASSLTSFGAVAADKAPEPDFSISGNFGITSDYRFRGVSQTNKGPAFQGGFDITHKSGFAAGVWGSNVSEWTAPQGAGLETDIYASYSKEVVGIGLSVGGISYMYPGSKVGTNTDGYDANKNYWNTQELFAGLSYGPVAYKVSRTMSDYYFSLGKDGPGAVSGFTGTGSAKGTLYHDFSFTFGLSEKASIKAHYGILDLKNSTGGDIKDVSISLSYDLGDGYSLGVAGVNTSGMNTAAKGFFTNTATSKKLYDSGGYISITKTF